MIEYRVRWSATSNTNFRGETEWREWDDPDMTLEEVEAEFAEQGNIDIPVESVLGIFMLATGLDVDYELRER